MHDNNQASRWYVLLPTILQTVPVRLKESEKLNTHPGCNRSKFLPDYLLDWLTTTVSRTRIQIFAQPAS